MPTALQTQTPSPIAKLQSLARNINAFADDRPLQGVVYATAAY